MIRFDVVVREDSFDNVIVNPSNNVQKLTVFYNEKMMEASALKTDLLYFESIAFEEKRSINFQNINILEKCIMDYLHENEYPKKVCIVCDTLEKAELYKVVYNFYYPEIEDERLVDALWN